MKLPSLRETRFDPTLRFSLFLSLPFSFAPCHPFDCGSFQREMYIYAYCVYSVHPHVGYSYVYMVDAVYTSEGRFYCAIFPTPNTRPLLGDGTKVMAPSETRNSTPRDTWDLWSVVWCLRCFPSSSSSFLFLSLLFYFPLRGFSRFDSFHFVIPRSLGLFGCFALSEILFSRIVEIFFGKGKTSCRNFSEYKSVLLEYRIEEYRIFYGTYLIKKYSFKVTDYYP